jgi:hypothetical protein
MESAFEKELSLQWNRFLCEGIKLSAHQYLLSCGMLSANPKGHIVSL